MSRAGLRRMAIAAAVLIAIQAGAVAIYLAVQRSREGPHRDRFRFETMPANLVAPDLVLERADRSRVTVHQLGGRVRLVHFWATWCPPCVEELPGLLATSRRLAERGLTLVAISMDDDWAAIRSFFGGQVPAEIYRAVDPDGHRAYDVVTLPDTYLVGPDGLLRLRYGGSRNWRTGAAVDHLDGQLR